LIIRDASYAQTRGVVRSEALFVEEMGHSLAKLDACRRVAILHGHTPQDVSEVELDHKVSVVRNRETAENIYVT